LQLVSLTCIRLKTKHNLYALVSCLSCRR
jgi:hypothetical protein